MTAKMEQYLAEGGRLAAAVAAHRAARDEASAEETGTQSVGPPTDYNKPKRRSYPLPPLDRPSELEGYPLNSPGQAVPDYGSMARVQAIKHRKLGARAPMKPIGEPQLRKRGQ